jgi:2-phosphosulfolactate phosphatase
LVERWETQHDFDVRFEWGLSGIRALGSEVAAVVVVDVLRFTTAVDAAVAAGVVVYPYKWCDGSAVEFARSVGAILADPDSATGPSLSPQGLMELPAGTSVVLPSPNGSACALEAAAQGLPVVAGCLCNASAVARWLDQQSRPVGVIACGELRDDGSLRPAVEDLLGASAILSGLGGSLSPEAESAVFAWDAAAGRLPELLDRSASGRALFARGFGEDVAWASAVDRSDCVPVLGDGVFRDAQG